MISASLFAACGSDDNPTEDKVEIPTGKESIEINDYATEEAVTFNATADWSVAVNEVSTRAANWVTVSPMRGGAGKSTITITITDTEYDGEEDRTAEIIITAGNGTPVKIYIIQKGNVHQVTPLTKRVKSITTNRIANEGDRYTADEYQYTSTTTFIYDDTQNRVKEITVKSEDKADYYREYADDYTESQWFHKGHLKIEGSVQIEYSDNLIKMTGSSIENSYSYDKNREKNYVILNETENTGPEWIPEYGWSSWTNWEINESEQESNNSLDYNYTLSDSKLTSLSYTLKEDNGNSIETLSEEAKYTYTDNRVSVIERKGNESGYNYDYKYNYIWSYGNIYQKVSKSGYTRNFYYDGYHANNLNIDLWHFLESEIAASSFDPATLLSTIGRRCKELPVKAEGHDSYNGLEYTATITYTKDSNGYITEILAEGLPEGRNYNATDSPTYKYTITYE